METDIHNNSNNTRTDDAVMFTPLCKTLFHAILAHSWPSLLYDKRVKYDNLSDTKRGFGNFQ